MRIFGRRDVNSVVRFVFKAEAQPTARARQGVSRDSPPTFYPQDRDEERSEFPPQSSLSDSFSESNRKEYKSVSFITNRNRTG